MQAIVYLQDQEYIALCDLLKLAGLCDSGGQAKAAITAGDVLRNGEVETRKTAKYSRWRSGGICRLPIGDLRWLRPRRIMPNARPLLRPKTGNAAAANAAMRAFTNSIAAKNRNTMRG